MNVKTGVAAGMNQWFEQASYFRLLLVGCGATLTLPVVVAAALSQSGGYREGERD